MEREKTKERNVKKTKKCYAPSNNKYHREKKTLLCDRLIFAIFKLIFGWWVHQQSSTIIDTLRVRKLVIVFIWLWNCFVLFCFLRSTNTCVQHTMCIHNMAHRTRMKVYFWATHFAAHSSSSACKCHLFSIMFLMYSHDLAHASLVGWSGGREKVSQSN